MDVHLAPELVLAADAVARGGDDRALARACAAGHLVRVARGAYVAASAWSRLDPRSRQIYRAVAAARTRRRRDLVLSHESAALVHGLPTWGWPEGPVEFVEAMSRRVRSSTDVRVHVGPVETGDVAVRDGLAVTDVTRTVLDLLLSRSREQAVVLADHVLRAGACSRDDLVRLVATRPHARNRRRAAWAVAFGDPLAGSPGESVSRVLAHDLGFVTPELQRRFDDAEGLVGVVDFFFPDPDGSGHGCVGEFDGAVKYRGDDFRHGRSAEAVVEEEKDRENRLRALPTVSGFARWDRRELAVPARLEARLLQAGVARRP